MAYTIEGLDPARSQVLAGIENETGPSNFFRMMALHEAGLRSFRDLQKAIMGPGSLDSRLKEMAYLAVSSVNETSYCTRHHEKDGLDAGLSAGEVHGIKTENDSSFTLRERAILRYARELTRNCAVEDDTRHDIQNHLSPEQQVEITEVICLANFTNRFTNGLAIALEK